MNRTPVKSSQIASVGYDSINQTMDVEFVRGNAVYRYHDVPAEIHEALMAAESVGKHFGANVRGRFRTEKFPKEEPNAAQGA